MMKCTEILMDEHQNILSRMNALEVDLEKEVIVVDDIKEHCRFISLYADDFHHAKEEEIYFKWMLSQRPELELGPIKCMLEDHNRGRQYVQQALRAIDDFKNGNEQASQVVKKNLIEFISLIRSHIEKEDEVLYKMADSLNDRDGTGDEVMMEHFHRVNSTYASKVAAFFEGEQ